MTQLLPSLAPPAADPPPWAGSFLVDDDPDGAIKLRQIGINDFALESTVEYIGAKTGLEGKVDAACLAEIRRVGPASLPVTDLTSVPRALRWFVSQYGSHTPAALVHDRLIGIDPPIPGFTDAYADRFFRVMLQDLGVRWMRRWLMWSAVAVRTRSKSGLLKLVGLVIWCLGSLTGMTAAVVAVATHGWLLLLLSAVAPFVLALLWGRQYGAGLVGALAAPWILPPTVLGVAGFLVYAALEWTIGLFGRDHDEHPERLSYESF